MHVDQLIPKENSSLLNKLTLRLLPSLQDDHVNITLTQAQYYLLLQLD